MLASAGVLGVAVAFAAKDTVANLFGGISVFFDKPYKIGDYIRVKDKYRGQVIEIGVRSTKIETRDNILITVPNSAMVTDAVINETGIDPKLRLQIPLGVAYGSDLSKVEKILIGLLKKNPSVLSDPTPRVRFRKFGDSAIELDVMVMIKDPAEKGIVIHKLIKEINTTFKRRGFHPVPSKGYSYLQQLVHKLESRKHKVCEFFIVVNFWFLSCVVLFNLVKELFV